MMLKTGFKGLIILGFILMICVGCKDSTDNKDATSDSKTGFSISGTITLPTDNCLTIQKNDSWRIVAFHSIDQVETTDDIITGVIPSDGATSFTYEGLIVPKAGTYIFDAEVNKTGNFGKEQNFFTGASGDVYVDADKVVNFTLSEMGCY